ncbi:hypothetical protein ELI38_04460 [Rhizobium leguminosarum]|nr:hypothetical protein [Rhizobium leguminosarum bv. viciae]TAU19792.1 hypothetical protein ELI50_03975 [Rhizobium leguminosarum]NKK84082.1 hypothetical protein [Rhizobium leguminosarum bv. viciae]TAU39799.1 hypothetical protein ELI51_04715 [Rhizobium leguminosarum]TAU95294.1 hypothetical protein ELI38_04460 [Rhizobium leguminosarum]
MNFRAGHASANTNREVSQSRRDKPRGPITSRDGTRFDDTLDPYTPEQIARERDRYRRTA